MNQAWRELYEAKRFFDGIFNSPLSEWLWPGFLWWNRSWSGWPSSANPCIRSSIRISSREGASTGGDMEHGAGLVASW